MQLPEKGSAPECNSGASWVEDPTPDYNSGASWFEGPTPDYNSGASWFEGPTPDYNSGASWDPFTPQLVHPPQARPGVALLDVPFWRSLTPPGSNRWPPVQATTGLEEIGPLELDVEEV